MEISYARCRESPILCQTQEREVKDHGSMIRAAHTYHQNTNWKSIPKSFEPDVTIYPAHCFTGTLACLPVVIHFRDHDIRWMGDHGTSNTCIPSVHVVVRNSRNTNPQYNLLKRTLQSAVMLYKMTWGFQDNHRSALLSSQKS